MTIEGDWRGHYSDRGRGGLTDSEEGIQFPISASFYFKRGELFGNMLDENPTFDSAYSEIVELHRHEMSPEAERKADEFLERFPDTVLKSTLPSNSLLRGKFQSPRIEFVKEYQGWHEMYWLIDGRRQTVVREHNHRVWYEGSLSEDGTVISGTWKIKEPGILGLWKEPKSTGVFRLDRVE